MSYKTTDIPHELKTFWKILSPLFHSRNCANVFEDFVTIVLTQFMLPEHGDSLHSEAIKSYSYKEKEMINLAFKEMLDVMKTQIDIHGWYDFFGEIYMAISSRWKSSAMGQFFTPVPICDLMTNVLYPSNQTGQNIKINDPSCGSGRTLLSYNAVNPGNLFFAEDLDPLCVKMCTINFCFHGMQGEVVCHDTLCEPDTIRHGYKLKYYKGTPVMQVIPITTEEAHLSFIKMEEVNELYNQINSNKEVEVAMKSHLLSSSEHKVQLEKVEQLSFL